MIYKGTLDCYLVHKINCWNKVRQYVHNSQYKAVKSYECSCILGVMRVICIICVNSVLLYNIYY